MAGSRASPHSHGRSEVWARPAVAKAIAKAKRTLGLRIRALREERSWTQEQAAEAIGVHAKHIVRIEGGTANVTIATIVAVATAFKVPVAALFQAD